MPYKEKTTREKEIFSEPIVLDPMKEVEIETEPSNKQLWQELYKSNPPEKAQLPGAFDDSNISLPTPPVAAKMSPDSQGVEDSTSEAVVESKRDQPPPIPAAMNLDDISRDLEDLD